MKLDSNYQFQLLELMAETYPGPCNILTHTQLFIGTGRLKYIANISYLESHGLVNSGLLQSPSGHVIGSPSITHKGMDFISEDGGLSSLINVVNIRFCLDDLREILRDGTNILDKPVSEKWG